MRNKKVIALAMAAIVGMASAPAVYNNVIVAEADEVQSTNSIKFDGWWTAHSFGDEITEKETTVKFRSKTDESTLDNENWMTPIVVVYYCNENKVNIENPEYKEVLVVRSDLYAWSGAANTGDQSAAFEAAGFTFERENAPAAWLDWLNANKNGVDVSYTTQIKDNKVSVVLENNGVKSTTTFNLDQSQIDAGKKLYISVSGQQCEVSGLPQSLVTGEAEPTVAPTEVPAEPATSPAISTAPAVTEEPTTAPTEAPSEEPTTEPTVAPTQEPTTEPTVAPTTEPTETPAPTKKPSAKKAAIVVKNGKKSVSAVSVKAKKSVKLTVSVNSKAKVTAAKLSKKGAKIAKVTLKNNKLTVKGLKKGKVTIKLSAKKTSAYKAATKSLKVTVK